MGSREVWSLEVQLVCVRQSLSFYLSMSTCFFNFFGGLEQNQPTKELVMTKIHVICEAFIWTILIIPIAYSHAVKILINRLITMVRIFI